MSTTAIGPALDIDGPLPEKPRFTLLDIPGVLQEGGGRWQNGVAVHGYPTETPLSWEPCSDGTYRDKDEGGEVPLPLFHPVGLYLPITCDARQVGSNWRDFAGRASTALEARLSFGVEHVLSQGVVGSLNPFLGDADVTKLAAGAAQSNAATALAYLENAIGETGQRGMVHATPAVGTQWAAASLLQVVGDHLETYLGTPVAIGGGYIGAVANGTAAGAGNAWAFATGPVEVFVGDYRLVGDDINGTLDTTSNDVTFRAERYIVAEWDTALQSAVLVDWTP